MRKKYLAEVARVIGAEICGAKTHSAEIIGNPEITNLAYDSRQVSAGALFAALNGVQQRGADFIPVAIKNGAVAILTEDDLSAEKFAINIPYLRVENARLALAKIASAFYDYPTQKLQLIGITGTNGKTTTAYLLRYLLRALNEKVGMLGTIEYDIGNQIIPAPLTTPESVDFTKYLAQGVSAKLSYFVAEISSHALSLSRTAGCDFTAAIFSNLTRDHLDYHHTIENYALAKQQLFNQLTEKSLAIINADDEFSAMMVKNCRAKIITYGIENPQANWRVIKIESRIDGSDCLLQTTNKEVNFFVPLPGKHNIYNALSAMATLSELNFSLPEIITALKNFTNVPGRLERLHHNNTNVFIDYAHTPDALEKILQTVKPLTLSELWVVFGCGGDRDRGKRPLMAKFAEQYADKVVVTNDNPRTEDPLRIIADIRAGFAQPQKVIYETDRARAIELAVRGAQKNDTIIIAGKGHEDYQIIGTTKTHFSDKEVVESLWKLR